ncbi:MAG: 2-oxo acid dehydrogenase subunit E2 [Verrucomicrobia bacterium]|nr:2-oxo acid dehydrogenase subunit E2 [Verrucomicrobiota bacterium]
MPKVPIIMPQLGESVAEATILRFKAQVGEPITSDQEIIEVETNKAVMAVTTPCDGVIAEFTAEVNQTYPNGAVLGYIEASEEDAERLAESASQAPAEVPATLPTDKNMPASVATMKVPIIMPQLGESVAEATIIRFNAQVGEPVASDQEIIEVETNKAVMGVTTPCGGVIAEFTAEVNQTYPNGAILGYIEASAEDAERLGVSAIQAPAEVPATLQTHKTPLAMPTITIPMMPAKSGGPFVSPRVRSKADQLGWQQQDLSLVPGTGKNGRVTANDVEKYLADLEQHPSQKATGLRLAIADAMRRSWSRPLCTIGVSFSLEPILAHRKQFKIPPGPALYVAKAIALGLAENPKLAARIVGDQLVLPKSIDIGVAVEVDEGVVVPVFKSLDKEPLSELGEKYQDLVTAARARRLPEDAREGAIASVTNYGPLGITWGTPIPQPTESLIVGLGRAEKRPVWDEASSQFKPKQMADLTVTFDHRVVDGGASGKLISRLVAILESPKSL